MPLRIFQSDSPTTFDDLHDAVLLALASSYPQITPSQEARLKARLLQIIEDWDVEPRDPEALMRRFREAIDGV